MERRYLLMSGVLLSTTLFAQEKPNIIIILADDMGFSDLGCYGGEIITPNIDELSSKSVNFTQFYTTSRSCPTRASLLTGLYQHQTGIGWMSEDPIKKGDKDPKDWGKYSYRGFLNRNCVTIAEVLKISGYHTYMSGKWHLGMHGKDKWPLQRGFDRFYGILAGACSYLKPDGARGLTLDNTHLPAPNAPYYTTDAFTDYAIKFIDEQKDDKPFFLYLAYNAPHWPLHAKQDDINKFYNFYRNKGWNEIREERLQRMINKGIVSKDVELSEWENRDWDELSESEKDESAYRMATYAAQIHCLDYNVGRLIDFLHDKDELDNTIILFMSDNGACAEPYVELGGGDIKDVNNPNSSWMPSYGRAWAQVSNTPFRKYKRRAYEGGISSPLIVFGNFKFEVREGLCHVPCFLPDIMATIIDVSESTYPTEYKGNKIHPLIGKSLLPVIKGEQGKLHDYMYWEHANNKAIRYGKWKAVCDESGTKWELFDIEKDRMERNDLSGKYKNIIEELSARWYKWAWEYKIYPKRTIIQ